MKKPRTCVRCGKIDAEPALTATQLNALLDALVVHSGALIGPLQHQHDAELEPYLKLGMLRSKLRELQCSIGGWCFFCRDAADAPPPPYLGDHAELGAADRLLCTCTECRAYTADLCRQTEALHEKYAAFERAAFERAAQARAARSPSQ